MSEVRHEYETRLAAWRSRAARFAKVDGALTWAYLGGIAALLAVMYLVVEKGMISPWWFGAPLAALAVFAFVGGAASRHGRRARRAIAFYERALSRLDGAWPSTGPTGELFTPPDHLFALDLDIVGPGSLYQHLCTARTRAGEHVLARWLLAPPSAPAARARQDVVRSLQADLDLREALAIAGPDAPDKTLPEELASWAEAPPLLSAPVARAAVMVLPGLAAIGLLGWTTLGWGPAPFIGAVGASTLLGRILRRRAAAVLAHVTDAHAGLASLAAVAARLEQSRFDHPYLSSLQERLLAGGRASRQIQTLGTRVAWLGMVQNDLAQPALQLFGGAASLAFAIESWRRRSGPYVRGWLEGIGEVEALCALASHSYEHPADPFPELVDGGPILDGRGMGHPLLPESRCVRNDVHLGRGGPSLLLLSGSNMSGKSTLLRTIGTNTVLAFAGAPVRARSLRVSPLNIGASIRVHDSLMGGASRFYAEIVRLRQIVQSLDSPLPVLFLLDEILHGTNSHDRRHGAEGVLRGLLERGGIGVCTTHDLALAEVVGAIGPHCRNAHFGDVLADGKLSFDFTLRSGIVRQSNAIELMRAVGLRV